MLTLEAELQHERLKSKATTPNGTGKDSAFDEREHDGDGRSLELEAASVYLSVGDEWEADDGRAVGEGERGKGGPPAATGLSMQAELAMLRELVHDLTAKLNAQTPRSHSRVYVRSSGGLTDFSTRPHTHLTHRPHSATPRAAPGGGAGAREAAGSDLFASAMGLYSFPAPHCRCSEKRRFAHQACLRFLARVFCEWQRRKEYMQRAKRFMRLRERRQCKALAVYVFRHWQKSQHTTKHLRAISAACCVRCLAKLWRLWRLETAAVRKGECNTESHLHRLRVSAASVWREHAAVRTAAKRHLQRSVERGLARAVECLARQRLVSRKIQGRVTSLKGKSMEEWKSACLQETTTRQTLTGKWHSYLVAQSSAWEARSKSTASVACKEWVRCSKQRKRMKLLCSRQSRQHQRQLLDGWATRARQAARARLQRKAVDVAVIGIVFESWRQHVHSSKQAVRAGRRQLHQLLSAWCDHVRRVNAAQELARGITRVENTRILKVWSKFAIAWQPVRHFRKEHARMLRMRTRSYSIQRWRESCHNRQAVRGWLKTKEVLGVMRTLRAHANRWRERTTNRGAVAAFCQRKRRTRFQATFSDILSRWSEDAAWAKAVSVHAEFLGIERNNKSDAPCFRLWLAHTRMQSERQAKVKTAGCRRAVRLQSAACGWWRSWASARVVARNAIRALAGRMLHDAWNAWWNLAYATRRKLQFFIAYRARGNKRKSFEAFKWDNHRLACLQRANAEFDRRHLQSDMFEAWAAYSRQMRLYKEPSTPARPPPAAPLTERSPVRQSPAHPDMSPASSTHSPPLRTRPRSLNSTPRPAGAGRSMESLGVALSPAALSSAFR